MQFIALLVVTTLQNAVLCL